MPDESIFLYVPGGRDQGGTGFRRIDTYDDVILGSKIHKALENPSIGAVAVEFDVKLETKEIIQYSSALISRFAHQFQVFKCHPIWRRRIARQDYEPNSSEGIGSSPLHIDFVNSSKPPRYVFLIIERADPQLGGVPTISNLANALKKMSKDDISNLCFSIFSHGLFFDLQHIGHELRRFPIISKKEGEVILRYTEKISIEVDSLVNLNEVRNSFELLKSILRMNVELLPSKKNVLLIYNQAVVCHGRTALGDGQDFLQEEHRRVFLQSFGNPLR